MTGPEVKIGVAWRFFLPLIFMTELNMISKSVIHAFLARTPDPSATLAAFNTSFTFYYTVTGCTEVTVLLAISWLQGKRNLKRVAGFVGLLLTLPLVVVFLVAFTPIGTWLYGEVFGLGPQAMVQAVSSSAVFAVSAPILIMRGIAFALLMMNRRTLLITASTFVRLLTLSVSLLVWPLFVEGAVIGAAALVTCMFAEALFAWAFAAGCFARLPLHPPERPRTREMWRFSWPLVLNQSAEMGVVFIINLFLGRLARPELALAAFGVVHGLVSLIMSPLRNLAQTGQTLAASSADARMLTRFTAQLAGAFSAIAICLFWVPTLESLILTQLMGLTPEMNQYSGPAMRAAFAMAAFWGFAALFRGLLASVRSTTTLALTAALKMGTAAVVGATALVFPNVNGAVLGLGAWVLAYVVEVGFLVPRVKRAWT